MKIGFYLLGRKGYFVLNEYIKAFGLDSIAFVIGGQDMGVDNDWYNEILDLCNENGLYFFSRRDINYDFLSNAEYIFAIGWRWLITDFCNLIVFHDSLLPKYRGFSPLVNMLIDGCETIGVTAMLASCEYDKGPIISQISRQITYPIKISEAIDIIIPIYVEIVIDVAKNILKFGRFDSFAQDEKYASYSLWRDERDYFVDWNDDSNKIKRFVDAVGSPYGGASTILNGKLVRILDVSPVEDVTIENRLSSIGKLIFFEGKCPVIVCGQGLIKIIRMCYDDSRVLVESIPFRSRFENKL